MPPNPATILGATANYCSSNRATIDCALALSICHDLVSSSAQYRRPNKPLGCLFRVFPNLPNAPGARCLLCRWPYNPNIGPKTGLPNRANHFSIPSSLKQHCRAYRCNPPSPPRALAINRARDVLRCSVTWPQRPGKGAVSPTAPFLFSEARQLALRPEPRAAQPTIQHG